MQQSMSSVEKEIMKTINKFGYGDCKGIHEGIPTHEFTTIQRKLSKLVKEGYVSNMKMRDNSKVYSLTEEGKKLAKRLEENFIAPTQVEFQLNKLHFYTFLEKKVEFVEDKMKDERVDIFGTDIEEKKYALFMQRQSGIEGIKELLYRSLDVIKEIPNIESLYYQIFENDFKEKVETFAQTITEEKGIKVQLFELENNNRYKK